MDTSKLLRGLSAYIPCRNGERLDYPWREVGLSLLEVADELVLCDSDSDDGTREAMDEWAKRDPRVRVVNWRWPNLPTFETVSKGLPGPPGQPRFLIDWLNYARQFCRYDCQITSDSDEILCPKGIPRIREAVDNRECLWFFRLNFWRDIRHLARDGTVVGSYVARMGETRMLMTSDEPRPEGEPEMRIRAVKHPSLRFFHVGFLRPQAAFLAKSKVVAPAICNSYDPRLLEAERTGKSWFDLTDIGELVEYTADDYPDVIKPWLRARGLLP